MSRGRPSKAHLPWHTVNWGRTNAAIAADLGCHLSTVAKYRLLHTGSTKRPVYINWETVTRADWETTSNARLAERLGTTRHTVNGYRCRWGMPKGPRSPGSGLWKRVANE